jgi:hypothetical protein
LKLFVDRSAAMCAAVRYNLDSHEVQRLALNDEKVRLVVKRPGVK